MRLAVPLLFLAACASHPPAIPKVTRPIRQCAPFSATSPDGRAHSIWLSYRVDSDGRVTTIVALNAAPEWLQTAAAGWLRSCPHEPGREGGAPVPLDLEMVLTVRPDPPQPEEIIEAVGPLARGLSEVHPTDECRWRFEDVYRAPIHREDGAFDFRVTVHSTGVVDDVVIPKEAPRAVVEALGRWLTACPFQPLLVEGRPVSAHVTLHTSTRGFDASAYPLDPDLAPPKPKTCRTEVPEPPRSRRVGTVVMKYVVQRDGRTTNIRLQKPTFPELANSVQEWLEHCKFEPARRQSTGEVEAVEIVQPFIFRVKDY